MPDLQDLLNELQEREIDHLEAKRSALTEKIYPNLPAVLKVTSEATGVDVETLVKACAAAAWHYDGLEWHNILDIVRSFTVARQRIEKGKQV
jgi:hypothetical protein